MNKSTELSSSPFVIGQRSPARRMTSGSAGGLGRGVTSGCAVASVVVVCMDMTFDAEDGEAKGEVEGIKIRRPIQSLCGRRRTGSDSTRRINKIK
jgi:hypothetical protein